MRTSWKVSLRLARRQILRAKGRSALVVAMIGVPVLLIAVLSTLYRTALDPTESESALRTLGSADALLTPQDGPVTQDPAGMFIEPAGDASPRTWSPEQVAAAADGKVTPYRIGKDRVLIPTRTGARAIEGHEIDLRVPVAAGLATVTDGRLPSTIEEVAVSRALANRGYATGDRITIDGQGTRTVVGVLRMNQVGPATELVAGLPGSVLSDANASTAYLVDTGGRAVSWEKVQELNGLGIAVQSRAVILDPPQSEYGVTEVSGGAESYAMLVLVVLIVVLEVVLLAGPAFAVSARRQARQLALVVATGATERHVRRIVLVQAAVLGAGSAIAGAGLGVGLVVVVRPWLEIPLDLLLYPLEVGTFDLLALVVVGTLAAVLAALVPAGQAARQDTVAVLAGRRGDVAGRRGDVAGRRGWPIVGLVLAVAGAAIVLFGAQLSGGGELPVAAGTVAIVLGAILVTPAVVRAVGKLGGRLPLPLRLASRDAARHTSRTAPVIAAIMATVSGLTVLAIASSSDFAEQRRDYQPQVAMGAMAITMWSGTPAEAEELVDQLARQIPGSRPQVAYETGPSAGADDSRELAVLGPSCRSADLSPCVFAHERQMIKETSEFYGNLVAPPDVVGAWLARPLPAEQRRVLERGGVLVADEKAIGPDGFVRAVTYQTRPGEQVPTAVDVREVRLPAAVLPPHGGQVRDHLTEAAMTPLTAKRLGLESTPSRIVVPPPAGGISAAQEDRIREFAAGVSPSINIYVERGYQDVSSTIYLILGVIGGLIVLVATGTATALALDDARPDFATLAAIGAAPRARRATAAAQAALTGGLGALFGVAVGVVPGLALTWPLTAPSTGGHVISVPWLLLGAVVVAVPLVAVLGAAGFTRSRLPMVRRLE